MFIAILQFQLLIDGAMGLKDKRRVVKSLKDRLHREHMVAVAEVGELETWNLASMGVVACGSDGAYLRTLMQTIVSKLRSLPDARLADHSVEVVGAEVVAGDATDDSGKPLWTEEDRRPAPPTHPIP
jgi:hypothetical protein